MTERPLLEPGRLAPAAAEYIGTFHADIVREVIAAVTAHPVVVVGMAQNPNVRRVRNALSEAGIAFEYLEYGSYLSSWHKRLAIKLWSGWPMFPQVFVRGTLLGGDELTRAAIADGSLRAKLEAGAPAGA